MQCLRRLELNVSFEVLGYFPHYAANKIELLSIHLLSSI